MWFLIAWCQSNWQFTWFSVLKTWPILSLWLWKPKKYKLFMWLIWKYKKCDVIIHIQVPMKNKTNKQIMQRKNCGGSEKRARKSIKKSNLFAFTLCLFRHSTLCWQKIRALCQKGFEILDFKGLQTNDANRWLPSQQVLVDSMWKIHRATFNQIHQNVKTNKAINRITFLKRLH